MKRTNNQYQSFRSSNRISTAIAPHPMDYRTGKIAVEYGTNVYEMEEQTDSKQSNHIVARLIRKCLRRYLGHYQRLHVVTVRRALWKPIMHHASCIITYAFTGKLCTNHSKRMRSHSSRKECKKPSIQLQITNIVTRK